MDWERARRRDATAAPKIVRPSAAQLRYIAAIADGLGITVSRVPETPREASLVIRGLKARAARARRR